MVNNSAGISRTSTPQAVIINVNTTNAPTKSKKFRVPDTSCNMAMPLSGLRHLQKYKILTNRRNAVFFCQILSFYLLYGVVYLFKLCYNGV